MKITARLPSVFSGQPLLLRMSRSQKKYTICVEFIFEEYHYVKWVAANNILKSTPLFFDNLLNNKDMFDSDVKIGFNDLSVELREKIINLNN